MHFYSSLSFSALFGDFLKVPTSVEGTDCVPLTSGSPAQKPTEPPPADLPAPPRDTLRGVPVSSSHAAPRTNEATHHLDGRRSRYPYTLLRMVERVPRLSSLARSRAKVRKPMDMGCVRGTRSERFYRLPAKTRTGPPADLRSYRQFSQPLPLMYHHGRLLLSCLLRTRYTGAVASSYSRLVDLR